MDFSTANFVRAFRVRADGADGTGGAAVAAAAPQATKTAARTKRALVMTPSLNLQPFQDGVLRDPSGRRVRRDRSRGSRCGGGPMPKLFGHPPRAGTVPQIIYYVELQNVFLR
ncbi:MAG TPA: hypothetical protein DEF59_00515 [Candidatus Magasanikbacteria bacterium]|nr:hypothetical protein [Candidatus Magasanikbacteria bacterium]